MWNVEPSSTARHGWLVAYVVLWHRGTGAPDELLWAAWDGGGSLALVILAAWKRAHSSKYQLFESLDKRKTKESQYQFETLAG